MRTIKINLARLFKEEKKSQMFSNHKQPEYEEGKRVVVQ